MARFAQARRWRLREKTSAQRKCGVETSGSFTKLRHQHVKGGIAVVREWDVRVGEKSWRIEPKRYWQIAMCVDSL